MEETSGRAAEEDRTPRTDWRAILSHKDNYQRRIYKMQWHHLWYMCYKIYTRNGNDQQDNRAAEGLAERTCTTSSPPRWPGRGHKELISNINDITLSISYTMTWRCSWRFFAFNTRQISVCEWRAESLIVLQEYQSELCNVRKILMVQHEKSSNYWILLLPLLFFAPCHNPKGMRTGDVMLPWSRWGSCGLQLEPLYLFTFFGKWLKSVLI